MSGIGAARLVVVLAVAMVGASPTTPEAPPTAPSKATVSAQKLLGATPGFYGSMAKLRLGMSKAQARVASPMLFESQRKSYDPVLYGLSFHPRRGLDGVFIHFMVPQGGVERGLTAAWGRGLACAPKATSAQPGTKGGAPNAAGDGQGPDDGFRLEPPPGTSTAKAPKVRSPVGPRTTRWTNKAGDMQIVLVKDKRQRAEMLRFTPQRTLADSGLERLIGMPVQAAIDRLAAAKGPRGVASVGSQAHPIELPAPLGAESVKLRWRLAQGRVASWTLSLDASACPATWRAQRQGLEGLVTRLGKSKADLVGRGDGKWMLHVR